jgi:hypothetical protein
VGRPHGAALPADELERSVAGLGPEVAFPEWPDLAAMVSTRLGRKHAEEPRRSGLGRWLRGGRPLGRPAVLRPVVQSRWQPVVAAIVVMTLAAGALLAASPGARKAVADFLGLRGVRIKVIPSSAAPSLLPTSIGGPLALGDHVTLAEAQARVPFDIVLPSDPRLGPPDEVYLNSVSTQDQVFLLWHARPGFPQASFTGAGLLLSEFRAMVDQEVLEKKLLVPGTTLEAVRVNGGAGFWISGEPHGLQFVAPDGTVLFDTTRLSGNVLLWERDDLTLRIEGQLTRDQALAVAASIHA